MKKKQKNKNSYFYLNFLLLFFFFFSSLSFAENSIVLKNILLVHSYQPVFELSRNISETFIQEINNSGDPVSLQVEFLDANNYGYEKGYEDYAKKILEIKLGHKKFDLVLVSDDFAFYFVLKHREDLFKGIPIVFCSVTHYRPEMNVNIRGITGVAEFPPFFETIELGLQLHPDTQEIIVISSERNVSGKKHLELLGAARARFEGRAKLTFWRGLALDELQKRCQSLESGQLVLLADVVENANGVILPLPDTCKRIREVCPVPIYSLWEHALGSGIVGGKLVEGRNHGRLAAELALRILRGENADALPILGQGENRFMFDFRELQRFGVSTKDLPEGSVVVNQPASNINVSKTVLIISGVWLVGLGMACVLLLRSNISGKRKLCSWKFKERQFNGYFELNLEGMAILSKDGRYLDVNNKFCQMLKYTRQDLLQLNWRDIIHPDDLASEIEGVASLLEKGFDVFYRNKRYIRKDGSIVDVFLSSKVLWDDDGEVESIVVVIQDISDLMRGLVCLEDHNQFLHALLDSIPLPIFYQDLNGIYLGCNQEFVKLVGRPREQIVGKSVYDICSENMADIYCAVDKSLIQKGGKQVYEGLVENAEGHLRNAVFSKACFFNGDGRTGGLVGAIQDITERKQAEEELLLNEARMEALLKIAQTEGGTIEDLADLVLAESISLTNSLDGFLGFVSEDQTRLTLHARSLHSLSQCGIKDPCREYLLEGWGVWRDIVQQKCPRVVNQVAENISTPQGHISVQRFVGVPLVENGNVSMVLGLANKEKEYSDTDVRQIALLGQALLDRMKRKQAEESLQQSNQENRLLYHRFHTILQGIPEPLGLISSSLKILWANQAFGNVLHCAPKDLVGESCYQIWPENSDPSLVCPIKRCFEISQVVEREIETEHGNIWFVKAFPMINAFGKVANVIVLASEITEKTRLQVEADRAGRLAALGELTVGIAHEINNPAGNLSLDIEILKEFFEHALPPLRAFVKDMDLSSFGMIKCSEFIEELPQMLEDMEGNARKIGQIVKDLKTFGGQDPSGLFERIALNDIVKVAVRLTGKVIEKATDNFGLSLHPSLPKIKANFQQIEQVIINLIMNACQALPDRSRGIRISTFFDDSRGQCVVKVQDEGKGMPPQILSRIHEPFFTTRRGDGGTGLGLSISLRIINDHKGEMQFSSQPDEGATVSVFLPIIIEGEI